MIQSEESCRGMINDSDPGDRRRAAPREQGACRRSFSFAWLLSRRPEGSIASVAHCIALACQEVIGLDPPRQHMPDAAVGICDG
jgi:hypothetical protein